MNELTHMKINGVVHRIVDPDIHAALCAKDKEIESLKAQLAECRDKALEEAAEACLSRIGEDDSGNAQAMNREAMDCAEAIRSLKGTKP